MMDAGRELDRLVAEKVMSIDLAAGYNQELEQPWTGDEIPHYSTDIAAAWEVLEAVKGRVLNNYTIPQPYSFVIEWGVQDSTSKQFVWVAGWQDSFPTEWILSAEAATAPHAICLAALKAVGAL